MGNWVDNIKEGMGCYIFDEGGKQERYEGPFLKDRRDTSSLDDMNLGRYFYNDGRYYEGHWKNG
jgi:hypothetical protein